MTAHQSASTSPDAPADRAPPPHGGRRRPAVRWIVHGALYRWRRTAISDAAIERAIERVFLPPHAAFVRFLARWFGRARRAGPHPGGT